MRKRHGGGRTGALAAEGVVHGSAEQVLSQEPLACADAQRRTAVVGLVPGHWQSYGLREHGMRTAYTGKQWIRTLRSC
jgi:hypothetical protein